MRWVKIFSDREEALKKIGENTPRLIIIGNERICLARYNDEFYGVQDKCSHNGESLSKGTINYLCEVVCPWHGHRFNLKTGREAGEQSHDLVTYPIQIDETGFYIGL